MGFDLDVMTYMIAAEKVSNLAHCMEQTLIWMEEYKVKPDDEVQKVLKPLVEHLKIWIEVGK